MHTRMSMSPLLVLIQCLCSHESLTLVHYLSLEAHNEIGIKRYYKMRCTQQLLHATVAYEIFNEVCSNILPIWLFVRQHKPNKQTQRIKNFIDTLVSHQTLIFMLHDLCAILVVEPLQCQATLEPTHRKFYELPAAMHRRIHKNTSQIVFEFQYVWTDLLIHLDSRHRMCSDLRGGHLNRWSNANIIRRNRWTFDCWRNSVAD